MSIDFGNKESIMQSTDVFVSETDAKGNIIYSDDTFTKISEYTREELIGKPHNLIRHPFMPSVAFKDLWDTVQDGNIWEGVVINKTKTGGYYWVKANVFKSQNPDGSVKYISVRIKPSKEEIDTVIKLYPTL